MVLHMLWGRDDIVGPNFRVFAVNGDSTCLGILKREKAAVFS